MEYVRAVLQHSVLLRIFLLMICSPTIFTSYVKPNYITSYFHLIFFFFLNDTATTEIYPLPLHDALPISARATAPAAARHGGDAALQRRGVERGRKAAGVRPEVPRGQADGDRRRPGTGRVADRRRCQPLPRRRPDDVELRADHGGRGTFDGGSGPHGRARRTPRA